MIRHEVKGGGGGTNIKRDHCQYQYYAVCDRIGEEKKKKTSAVKWASTSTRYEVQSRHEKFQPLLHIPVHQCNSFTTSANAKDNEMPLEQFRLNSQTAAASSLTQAPHILL